MLEVFITFFALLFLYTAFFRSYQVFKCVSILRVFNIHCPDTLTIYHGDIRAATLRDARHSLDRAIVERVHSLSFRGTHLMREVRLFAFTDNGKKTDIVIAVELMEALFLECKARTAIGTQSMTVHLPQHLDLNMFRDMKFRSLGGSKLFERWAGLVREWNAFYDLFHEVVKGSLFYTAGSSEEKGKVFTARH